MSLLDIAAGTCICPEEEVLNVSIGILRSHMVRELDKSTSVVNESTHWHVRMLNPVLEEIETMVLKFSS